MTSKAHRTRDLNEERLIKEGATLSDGRQKRPSTKPVLTGAAIGAIAGGVLPVVTWPLGLVAGAGFMLYKRLRP